MFGSPMTTIVVFLAGVFVAVGLLLLRQALRGEPKQETQSTCRRCQQVNLSHARFCARCGLRLK